QVGQYVRVAPHQRTLGDDADRVAEVAADLEASAREAVDRLGRLVAVGHAGKDDRVALPRPARQLAAQQLRRVDLRDDLAVEVRARAPAEVLVRGAGIAVRAGMEASAVRVDAVAEADVRAL